MQNKMCLHQFIRPSPSVTKREGWGWCVRKLDDGTIEYCQKHKDNKHCAGYYPITVTIIDIKDKK